MRKIYSSILILVALFVYACPSLAEPTDLKAWDRLRFGMNQAEVSAILGHMVIVLDNGGRFTHEIDGTYRGYRLSFSFGPSGLERVLLRDPAGEGLASRFILLEERLILNYGAPFRDETRSNAVRTQSWITPSTLVQLLYRPAAQGLNNQRIQNRLASLAPLLSSENPEEPKGNETPQIPAEQQGQEGLLHVMYVWRNAPNFKNF